MILCFGVFANILNLCKRGLPQDKFVPRIAWVVDRQNSSLASDLNYVVDDPDGMEGNKSVVSKLLSCVRPLILKDTQLPSLAVARERFKSKVMPFIKDDRVAKAVLATLYIISEDKTIRDERKERFREYLGMYRDELLQQTTFNVPDFFARVLLYTTCVDNNEGRSYAKKITDAFIEKIVKESWAEIKWDATTQAITIMPTAEGEFRAEIEELSELRRSLMIEPVNYVDTGWLGVDESVLFPSRYGKIEFKDPAVKKKVFDKMEQYAKLVQEFIECSMKGQQSAARQSVNWPIFPNERMQAIRQQLEDISDELCTLYTLSVFSDRFSSQ